MESIDATLVLMVIGFVTIIVTADVIERTFFRKNK